ncbi:MAG: peptide deformylase [Anaerolineae bacterium]|jgi:peptide deformylase|nr:peptide deformylase [Anaerolineae bacterium]
MALRDIIVLPDPILRRKARKVTQFDQGFQRLVDDMVETMRDAPGVGLAAPQVAVSERLIVVEYGEEDEEGNPIEPKRLYAVANPEIVVASTEQVNGIEACLSIPGLVGAVERYESVVIKGQNRRGVPVKIKARGWLARIFQHEIDHLDGILYPDRASRVWQSREDEVVAAE